MSEKEKLSEMFKTMAFFRSQNCEINLQGKANPRKLRTEKFSKIRISLKDIQIFKYSGDYPNKDIGYG